MWRYSQAIYYLLNFLSASHKEWTIFPTLVISARKTLKLMYIGRIASQNLATEVHVGGKGRQSFWAVPQKMTRGTLEVRYDNSLTELTFNIWHLTLKFVIWLWNLTFDICHLTFDICHLTFDICHLTFDIRFRHLHWWTEWKSEKSCWIDIWLW